MQELLSNLLCDAPNISEAVCRFCDAIPEYAAAKRDYQAVAGRVAEVVGFDLYDEFQTRLLAYSDYEIRAYYAFGLGLRQELLRQLMG